MEDRHQPFDLDSVKGEWADALRETCPVQFQHGGSRMAVALRSGDRLLGALVLADRVGGAPYTHEELELLECLADEVSAGLANRSLAEELFQAKELEAFQTMSAFFVHDLKNAASGLNLTLQNLPIHFDDPEFREDALRGLGKTADRINQLTERLSTLRRKLDFAPEEADLNEIIEQALAQCPPIEGIQLKKDLSPLPSVMADPEQIGSVITNLVNNAREAMGEGGKVEIWTAQENDRAVVTVKDDGAGMSPEFLRDSLFKPFQSTKKQGLGIGMFQARMIVEAHKGGLRVESEPGVGTTFWFTLPLHRPRAD